MRTRTGTPGSLSSRRTFRDDVVGVLRRVKAGEAVSAELRTLAAFCLNLPGGDTPGDVFWGWGKALEALAMAVEWGPAVAAADLNPGRFRDAARAQADAILSGNEVAHWPPGLRDALNGLRTIDTPATARQLAEQLLRVALPVRMTWITMPAARERGRPTARSEDPPTRIAPVLVLLSIDDEYILSPLAIRPGAVYRLRVELRVLSWTEGADSLLVDFVSVLPQSILELPRAVLTPSLMAATTALQLRGALVNPDVPEEIITRAAYLGPGDQLRPARVIGHPRWRLTSFDPLTALPRNLPTVATHLLAMLRELDAKLPMLRREDRDAFFVLFESLLRYANRSMQRRRLTDAEPMKEAQFQAELKDHFAADREIGARLWEGTRIAGGITDLGLEGVALELKVSHETVELDDTAKFMSQAAHYGAGLDRPVSILCILDDSEKNSPPGTLANYMRWLYPKLHGMADPAYPSMVAVLIVPIRFPTPSEWSR